MLGLVLGALSLACAHGAAPSAPTALAASAAPAPRGSTAAGPAKLPAPRSYALPGAGDGPVFREPDGTERYLLHGLRLTRRADGSIARGRQLLPTANVAAVELPERVGGGYLFHHRISGDALLWRADDWTGRLRPLSRVDLDVETISVGFDRLHLIARGTRELVSLDPDTGAIVDSGSLPATMAVRSLAIADPWFGAIDLPYRGALVTFDAGASWHPLGLGSVRELGLLRGAVAARVGASLFAIDRGGHVTAVERSEPEGSEEGGDRERVAITPRRAPLRLRDAVLRGWLDSPKTAVVLVDGDLLRVRLTDGAVIDHKDGVVDGGAECQALRFGESFGFVCSRQHAGTHVVRFDPPLGIEPVIDFDEPRSVSPGGTGALAIRGACADEPDGVDTGLYCIVGVDGSRRELRVRGDRGVERVVALASGAVAVLVPPRLGAPGVVTWIEGSNARGVELALPRVDSVRRALLRRGLWLDGFRELPGGALGGWVAGGSTFLGVRVEPSGRVTAGELAPDLDRSILAGPFALTLLREGNLRETTDGGRKWREVDPGLDVAPLLVNRRQEQGCSAVGCAVGDWLRVGWQGGGEPDPLASAATPRGAVVSGAATTRWLLRCALDPAVRVPGLPSPPPPRARPRPPQSAPASSVAELLSTPWLALGGPPPPLRPDQIGLDAALESPAGAFRAYLVGPREGDWSRSGSWLVRGWDAFDPTGAVWSTAASPASWPDVAAAAQSLGVAPQGRSAPDWTIATDPVEAAAVLSVNSATGRELYVAEAGRTLRPVPGSTALEAVGVAGVARVSGSVYFGIAGGSFRVYRARSDRLSLVGDYPGLESGNRPGSAALVRSVRGEALGIWVGAERTRGAMTRWFVYPIDPQTGAVEPPLVLEPSALGATPEPCSPDADGWLITSAPPVMPWLELGEGERPSSLNNVQARVIASATGLCLLGLVADGELPPAGTGRPAAERPHSTLPLVLTAADRPSSRSLLRCHP